jgi:DNA-binding IclR family transcriptional regulator
MPPEQRRLLIDLTTAEDVRVRVGPIGWVILEAIASFAPPGAGVTEVECSARSLAGLVRVSKDTVARSLASMIALGFVERVDHRDELSGRFLSTTYRVDPSTVGISVVVSQMPAPAPRTGAPTRSPARKPAAQLSLLS